MLYDTKEQREDFAKYWESLLKENKIPTSEKMAVFTTDPKLQVALLKFLNEQETTAPDSTLIVVGYNDRQRAIDYLAKDIAVNTDNPNKFVIEDDPDFMDNLAEDLAEAALDLAREEYKCKMKES